MCFRICFLNLQCVTVAPAKLNQYLYVKIGTAFSNTRTRFSRFRFRSHRLASTCIVQPRGCSFSLRGMAHHACITTQTITVWRRQRARCNRELNFVAGVRPRLADAWLLNFRVVFSLRGWAQHDYLIIQTMIVWRRQRVRNNFELQVVAGVRAPFAGPYLLNFELMFI